VVELPVHRLVECVYPGYYADTHSPGEKAAAAASGATGTATPSPTGAQAEVK
jgi:hypothetical protein